MADTNVLVAAAITPRGLCGRLLTAAIDGRWTLVVSPLLVGELEEVLGRDKFRRWLSHADAHRFVANVRSSPTSCRTRPPPATARPLISDDEFLVALAASADVVALVSGDPHLTDVAELDPPVLTPTDFLASLSP